MLAPRGGPRGKILIGARYSCGATWRATTYVNCGPNGPHRKETHRRQLKGLLHNYIVRV